MHDQPDAVGIHTSRCPRDILDGRRRPLSSRHQPRPSLPACYPTRPCYASTRVMLMTPRHRSPCACAQGRPACPVRSAPHQRVASIVTTHAPSRICPWAAYRVHLQLRVRKWFCGNRACRRRIFTERLPTIAAPWARRTLRLAQRLVALGLALGGKAGVRLGHEWDLVVSRNTLLRMLRSCRCPPCPRLGCWGWTISPCANDTPMARSWWTWNRKPVVCFRSAPPNRWRSGCGSTPAGIVKLLGIKLSPGNRRYYPAMIAIDPPFRRPALSPLFPPNSRIAASSLDGTPARTADAVWGESVGQWGHTRTRIAGHALLTNPCMRCSRWRVGRCEFSHRLLR